MKTFVIGDIHGSYKALIQCIERSNFNKEEDLLIDLGDIVDGWSEVDKCVDELLTIKNRIDIRGNHDQWFVDWINTRHAPEIWRSQGGEGTLKCYLPMLHNSAELTEDGEEDLERLCKHEDFFLKQHYYYIDDKNRLFVHGGYDWHKSFKETSKDDLMWDRHMFQTACMWEAHALIHPENRNYFKEFREIFVGHTATTHGINWRLENNGEPMHVANLWNLDQGAGWDGKLTIMNVDTKEFWQSDNVKDLYKNEVNSRVK